MRNALEARRFVGRTSDLHAIGMWVANGTQGWFDYNADIYPANGVTIDPEDGAMCIVADSIMTKVVLGDWIVKYEVTDDENISSRNVFWVKAGLTPAVPTIEEAAQLVGGRQNFDAVMIAVSRVVEVYENPGPMPSYHYDVRRQFAQAWPLLSGAIDGLIRSKNLLDKSIARQENRD